MININESTKYDNFDFNELNQACDKCELCDLASTRSNVVIGSGPVPCNLMLIGEAPGHDEDIQGLPFVGRAGQLLTKIFESVGINREQEVYMTNTLKCRPPNNRNPLLSEIETCKPYLIRQIQLIKPKILILLGSPALKTILEEPLSISLVRGKWYKTTVPYMDDLLYIIPLFHPSYLLRNESREKGSPKWHTWNDIKEVKKALDFCSVSV